MSDSITSEETKKNELSHDASASQIFDRFSKDFLRFLREAHQIGKGTSEETKNTNISMMPTASSQIFDRFSKDFLRFLREAHPSFSLIL